MSDDSDDGWSQANKQKMGFPLAANEANDRYCHLSMSGPHPRHCVVDQCMAWAWIRREEVQTTPSVTEMPPQGEGKDEWVFVRWSAAGTCAIWQRPLGDKATGYCTVIRP